MSRPTRRGRRGMTMIEMMIALVIFGVIATSALAIFRSQRRALADGTDRAAALQNAAFAFDMLARDLRTAGAGAPDIQPWLIYGGQDVVAFNANYSTNVASDVFAVYYDPNAPAGSVSALTKTQRAAVPNSTFLYPDTSYLSGGSNSAAETIVFYFRPDSTTGRTDDFVLLRQVNRQAPELVSRNLLQTGATPFLMYLRVVVGSDSMQTIPQLALPVRHSVPIHLSPGDTAGFALIDSVRALRVAFTVTNGRSDSAERRRDLTRLIPIPNAGLAAKQSCGDAPMLGGPLTANLVNGPNGPMVRLTWLPATDESGGERDVVRYVIWRRAAANPDFGDPFLSIPAGAVSYSYDDAAVASGESYQYQLAAQDCTPLVSVPATSGTVAIP